jgi:hypothetical protein
MRGGKKSRDDGAHALSPEWAKSAPSADFRAARRFDIPPAPGKPEERGAVAGFVLYIPHRTPYLARSGGPDVPRKALLTPAGLNNLQGVTCVAHVSFAPGPGP